MNNIPTELKRYFTKEEINNLIDMKSTLFKCKVLVERVFKDMTDKAGEPYIYHLYRVAEKQTDMISKSAALLHDIIEDINDINENTLRYLSIDEEDEVIECAKLIKYTILDYKLKSKKSINVVSSTRYEREMSKYLVKSLEKMNKNNEGSKLKYIFYEIYSEKCDDIEKVYSKLINITKNNDNKFIKLKNLIGLIENKKIMSNNS